MIFRNCVMLDPEIMHGEPCFPGTRVPIERLFDTLRYGENLDGFVDNYDSVSKEQAIAVLAEACKVLLEQAKQAE